MVLKAEKVSKWFLRNRNGSNRFFALNETDFTLKEGEITVIAGHSGSGKSTFLNILSGLLTPSSGRVLADNKDIYGMTDKELSAFRNENYGLIPQGQTPVYSLSVIENVLLPYSIYSGYGKLPADVTERADGLLKKLGIIELKDVMPSELSGGELRRMAISRALMKNPQIIMADEPTGDLDDKNTEIILNVFKDLAKEGKSVLIITHDKEVFPYSDTLYSMKNGDLSKIK